MDRLNRFIALEKHAWFNKVFKKLTKDDVKFCIKYLDDNKSISKDDFAIKTVRIWLDNSNKPKAWKHMEELLIASM